MRKQQYDWCLKENMKLLDANIVLRYLLNDNLELSSQAEEIISSNRVTLLMEVIAEIVYVLSSVYKVPNKEIAETVIELGQVENVLFQDEQIAVVALNSFASLKLDFIDCVLYAHQLVNGSEVYSFDKKLMKVIEGYQA